MNSVQVPNGRMTTVRVSQDSDYPGEQAIAIDLRILPQVAVDQLRPIATQYAKAIKASPVAGTTFSVHVANYAYDSGKRVVGEVEVEGPRLQGAPVEWQAVGECRERTLGSRRRLSVQSSARTVGVAEVTANGKHQPDPARTSAPIFQAEGGAFASLVLGWRIRLLWHLHDDYLVRAE
ncbi:hypothetical protein ACYAFX_28620 (plasmid) [Rhodococcus aetherivorans]